MAEFLPQPPQGPTHFPRREAPPPSAPQSERAHNFMLQSSDFHALESEISHLGSGGAKFYDNRKSGSSSP